MSPRIAEGDVGRIAIGLLLGDGVGSIRAACDVVRAAHAGPLTKERALGREDLDAAVGSVGNIELAVVVDRDAVRQMELSLGMARRAPGRDELAVACEAVHAGIAVAVGYINVAIRVGDHFGGVVERPGGAFCQPWRAGAAGVGMNAALAQFEQGLAVKSERLRDRV
jgi:hypothetical protein